MPNQARSVADVDSHRFLRDLDRDRWARCLRFCGIALNRKEAISAAWLVTAAICVYLIAYRFYSKFIAEKVCQLDDTADNTSRAPQRRPRLRSD